MADSKQIHMCWKWQLAANPRQLWPFITNTNRLFRDLKQPPVREADLSQSTDPGFTQLSFKGINHYEVWEEEPYEWEYPYRFGVKRQYKSGPIRKLKIQVDLIPQDSGTLLQVDFWVQPGFNLISSIAVFKLKTIIKNRFRKTVQKYDRLAVNNKKAYQLESGMHLMRGGEKRLNQIQEKLVNQKVDKRILEYIIDYISRADNLELRQIKPYELARLWEMPKEKVLDVFIYAAKAGLLNFNWDLYCPKCRTLQQSVKTLNQIHEPIFCDTCEKEFNIDFNKTIQLSFRPHPLIRKIETEDYCTRGPQSHAHIYIQQYLKSGEKRFLKTKLPEGRYILRTNQSKETAQIEIKKGGDATVHISFRDRGLKNEQVEISPEPNLSFENASDHPQIITLERKSWDPNIVSAAEATSKQLFRNLFSDEVLRRGEKIKVQDITLMFTDLFDSAGFYNKEGDDKAVGQVIDHFDVLQKAIARSQGAIVKTIGDSVMAVFYKPEHAIKAYLESQKLLAADERFKNNLQLKAGIHHGSCVAANLNSRIDYFGSTVNIASRFADHASENEVVLSRNLFSNEELKNLLNSFEIPTTIQNGDTKLKGFDSEHFSISRIKIDNSPLRLVI